jgi:hypothetical protein
MDMLQKAYEEAKKQATQPQGYAMLENVNSVVLPVEIATQVFALLCQGEKVSYDWQTKTHRLVTDSMPTLKMFSIAEYATLHLEEPMKD